MSLDLGRLENVRELANGVLQARCPACAEGGHDVAAEHLRVYPDGRFGCCVYPKDREHRKRIFALAGDKTPRQFTVKVSSGKPPVEAARSVTESLTGMLRTFRTGDSESDSSATLPTAGDLFPNEDFRTLRTPILMSCAYAREDEVVMCNVTHMCKDNERGVLSVLSPPTERLPYFTPGGTLVIPFSSPERYHYWKPGQRLSPDETHAEVVQRMASATQSVETPEAEHGQADKEAQKQNRVEAPEGRLDPEHGDAHSHPNSEEERQKEQTDATNPF